MKYLSARFQITDLKGNRISDESFLQTIKDIICCYAGEAGFESFEDDEDCVIGYVQKTLFNEDVLSCYLQNIPLQNVKVVYNLCDVEDKNWNEAWEEKGFESIIIDGRCIIHDTMHAPDIIDNGMLDITIDTKQAFGTGTHETTFMIISELLGIDLNNKYVLDCGCGTGILSIITSKLGAAKIVGYDIDEWSVNNTKHNCKINNVMNVKALQGDATIIDSLTDRFDLVMANINRNILLADIPLFKKVMASDALLLLSGFYEDDAKLLIDKACTLGLTYVSQVTRNKWCMLKFINKA